MKTECDYLNGWIKKRSHTQKSHPKMMSPRDIAGERRRRRRRRRMWPFSSSSYVRQRCLSPSWKWLSSSAPPGCHKACPSVVLVQATCPTSEHHIHGSAAVDLLQSWCLRCMGTSQTHQPWPCCTCGEKNNSGKNMMKSMMMWWW